MSDEATIIDKLNYIKDEKTNKMLPANIKSGVHILDVTGTYTSDANATATDIKSGKTAYVKGNKISGSYVEVMTASEYNSALNTANTILGRPDYTELEYIQSTGTQWINMNKVFKNNYKIETKFQYYDSSELSGEPFGTRTFNGTNTLNNIFLSTYQNCWFAWGNIETSIGNVTIGTKTWELVVDKNKWYLNGSLKSTMSNTTFTSEIMYLFAENFNRTDTSQHYVAYKSKTRIWYFRLYNESGMLLINLIPVQRAEDNEICMFDLISNQFFTNQGTGVFTAGPVKS